MKGTATMTNTTSYLVRKTDGTFRCDNSVGWTDCTAYAHHYTAKQAAFWVKYLAKRGVAVTVVAAEAGA